MVAVDEYFRDVTCLNHFEGAGGSITFTDSSLLSTDWNTLSGTPSITASDFKYGAGSLALGSGDSINHPTSSSFDFGSGDFTLEFFVKITETVSDVYELCNKMTASTTDLSFRIYFTKINNWFACTYSLNGTSVQYTFRIPSTLSNWNHIALSRVGTSINFYVNGNKAVAQNIGTSSIYSSSVLAEIAPVANSVFIDEFRVTKGVGRYSDTFTPPTEPFPEASGFDDTVSDNFIYSPTMLDIENLTDNADFQAIYINNNSAGTSISDNITLASGFLLKETLNLVDNLAMSTPYYTSMATSKSIQESINILDSLLVNYSEQIIDTINVDNSISNILYVITNVLDNIRQVDSLSDVATFKNYLSDVIDILDSIDFAKSVDITDNINIIDSLVELSNLMELVLESANISDNLGSSILYLVITSSGLNITDSTETKTLFNSLISDNIELLVSDTLDPEFISYLLSPETFSVSTYSNYNFIGSCIYKATPLFINNGGLYKYGGPLDITEDIVSTIQTAALSFGSSNLKQVPSIYLGLSNSNNIVLKVSVDGKADILYSLTKKTDGLQTQKISIGKGLIGRYFQFELITQDSTQFEMESIEFLPITLKRKL